MSRTNHFFWMALNVSDYRRDTHRLTTLEHGAYMLLLMEYWESGGLPDNERQLAQIALLPRGHARHVLATLKPFFQHPGWKHKRVEEELAKAASLSETRAAIAKKRWHTKQPIKPGNDRQESMRKEGKPNKNNGGQMQLHTDNGQANDGLLRVHEEQVKSQQNQGAFDAIASYNLQSTDIQRDSLFVLEREREALGSPIPKEKGKKMRKVKLRSQIPPDALPSDSQLEAARSKGMDEATIEHEWEKFRSHHAARGTLFADWNAGWLHWCCNWISYGRRQIGTAPRSNRNPALELYEKELEYERRTGRNFYTDPDNPSLAELFKH